MSQTPVYLCNHAPIRSYTHPCTKLIRPCTPTPYIYSSTQIVRRVFAFKVVWCISQGLSPMHSPISMLVKSVCGSICAGTQRTQICALSYIHIYIYTHRGIHMHSLNGVFIHNEREHKCTPTSITDSFVSKSEQQRLVNKCVELGRLDGGFFHCHNEKTKHMKVRGWMHRCAGARGLLLLVCVCVCVCVCLRARARSFHAYESSNVRTCGVLLARVFECTLM